MAEFDLNLSTRPFPSYRLINIVLAGILVVMVVLSAWQAIGFVRYSRLARAIRPAENNARVEAETLGSRVTELESRLDRPEATAKLNEIGFFNHLIARKNLSWTRLLADLEHMVPNNVHLLSLSPQIGANGAITILFDVQGRSIRDVSEFINRLEKSPVFQNIAVSTESLKRENTATTASTDVEVFLTATYRPEREER